MRKNTFSVLSEKKRTEEYKGFLYIKCEKCGGIKGFCVKDKLKYYKCECGHKTELNDLKRLLVSCECGRFFRYQTNMTQTEFDVCCRDCGSPVAVEWNNKRKRYETMRNQ